jgi:hypothetical protein
MKGSTTCTASCTSRYLHSPHTLLKLFFSNILRPVDTIWFGLIWFGSGRVNKGKQVELVCLPSE